MIEFARILAGYPENERLFKRHILREYLQYKILSYIFQHKHGQKLCFLGGTALRIVHGNRRFSEDIDLDNRGLKENAFAELATYIGKELSRDGLKVEINEVTKLAYHCYIRFPSILFENGMSPIKEEKILIQIDSEPQDYPIERELFPINRFDVFGTIYVTPLKMLLSQKIATILQRKRKKGRDFYDVSFLAGMTGYEPGYLKKLFGYSDEHSVQLALDELCATIDMKSLGRDVEPFLIDPRQIKRVTGFKDTISLVREDVRLT